ITYTVVERSVPVVAMRADSRGNHLLGDRARRRGKIVADRQYPDLFRGEPYRKRTGVVLDQNRNETLERTAHRAVNDHRPVRGIVFARVLELEPFGIAVVELDGAQLPRASDGIEYVEVDLRPIERAVFRLELVLVPRRLERRLERRLCAIPHL